MAKPRQKPRPARSSTRAKAPAMRSGLAAFESQAAIIGKAPKPNPADRGDRIQERVVKAVRMEGKRLVRPRSRGFRRNGEPREEQQ